MKRAYARILLYPRQQQGDIINAELMSPVGPVRNGGVVPGGSVVPGDSRQGLGDACKAVADLGRR